MVATRNVAASDLLNAAPIATIKIARASDPTSDGASTVGREIAVVPTLARGIATTTMRRAVCRLRYTSGRSSPAGLKRRRPAAERPQFINTASTKDGAGQSARLNGGCR
jgi:hypothetical protein